MWRNLNGERVFCTFEKNVVFDGVYVKDENYKFFDLTDAVKILEKDTFNLEVNLPIEHPALLYVVREGKINKVNVVVQPKYLDLQNEDFTSLLVSLGIMCGELSLKTRELFEIGKVTYSSGMVFGEKVDMRRVLLKEHKLMKDYTKEDFK